SGPGAGPRRGDRLRAAADVDGLGGAVRVESAGGGVSPRLSPARTLTPGPSPAPSLPPTPGEGRKDEKDHRDDNDNGFLCCSGRPRRAAPTDRPVAAVGPV